MNVTYCKLELLICLHFPMVATRINREGMLLCVIFSVYVLTIGVEPWRGFEFSLEGLKIEF